MEGASLLVTGMRFTRYEIFLGGLSFLGILPILGENNRVVEIHLVAVFEGMEGDCRVLFQLVAFCHIRWVPLG